MKVKVCFALICMLLFPIIVFSQQDTAAILKRTDELHEKFVQSYNSNTKKAEEYVKESIRLLEGTSLQRQLAAAYNSYGILLMFSSDYDASVTYLTKALTIRKSLGVWAAVASSYGNIALAYTNKGDLDKAIENYAIAINTINEHGIVNEESLASLNLNQSIVYIKKGDYPEAAKKLFAALKIAEQNKYNDIAANVYVNLGVIYKDQKEYESSLMYLQKAKELQIQLNDKRGLGNTYINISNILSDQHKYAEKLEYLLKAEVLKKELNEVSALSVIENNIGATYMAQGEYEKAIYYFDKSLQYEKKNKDNSRQATTLANIAEAYALWNKPEKADFYLTQAESYAKKSNHVLEIQKIAALAVRVREKQNKYKEAFEAQQQSEQLKDSLFDIDKLLMVKDLERKYQTEAKEREILLLKKEAQLKNTQLTNEMLQSRQLYLAVFFLLAIIMLFGYLYVIKRKYASTISLKLREIEEQSLQISDKNASLSLINKQLSLANEEKNNVIGILAHDIRTPLSNILMLSQLLKEDGDATEQNKEYATLINQASEDAIELAQNLLDIEKLEGGEYVLQKSKFNLRELIQYVVNGFVAQASNKNIILLTNLNMLPENAMAETDETVVKRILQNLLSNAIKFSPLNTQVEIRAYEEGSNFVVKIIDNGPGISSEDQSKMFKKYQRLSARPTGSETSSGLGLSIVKMLSEKIGAQLLCESIVGNGTTFTVHFAAKNS